MNNNLSVTLLVVVIAFFFFLVGRELVCWYWKINRQVELLEKILDQLKNREKKMISLLGNIPIKK